jgi:hypothetical protein
VILWLPKHPESRPIRNEQHNRQRSEPRHPRRSPVLELRSQRKLPRKRRLLRKKQRSEARNRASLLRERLPKRAPNPRSAPLRRGNLLLGRVGPYRSLYVRPLLHVRLRLSGRRKEAIRHRLHRRAHRADERNRRLQKHEPHRRAVRAVRIPLIRSLHVHRRSEPDHTER